MINPYFILAGVLIVIASFGTGYYKGYSAEHEKLLAFKADIESVAKQQELANKHTAELHNVITEGVKNEYETKLSALRNAYGKRVQQPSSSSGNVSSVSNAPIGVNGYTSDTDFVRQCAETTVMLVSLQSWLQKQMTVK